MNYLAPTSPAAMGEAVASRSQTPFGNVLALKLNFHGLRSQSEIGNERIL